MRKSITASTLSILTLVGIMTPTAVLAGTYKGKCFNKLEGDMDKCHVTIQAQKVYITMRSSGNQAANQVIPAKSIKKVERSKSAKRLSNTAIWTTLAFGPIGLLALAFKKKKMSYVVGYESEGKIEGAVFSIRRSRAGLADIDFENLGVKVVDLDAIKQ